MFGERTSRASSAGREQRAAGGCRAGAADAGRESSAAGALWQRQLEALCLWPWAVGDLGLEPEERATGLWLRFGFSGLADSSDIPFGLASSGRLWG